jgi:hypothetical protein
LVEESLWVASLDDFYGDSSVRDAVNQASQAQGIAGQTAGNYGAQAGGIAANLVPQLTRQMQNPQGMSQRDIGAQLTMGLAGAGGATSGLTGAADKMGEVTRNPMGFSAALDAAARARDKAAAGVGEGVAARNADVKLNQQSDAERGLTGLYGIDANSQLGAQRNQAADIDAEVNANKTGWLQNMNDTIATLTGAAKAAKPGGF